MIDPVLLKGSDHGLIIVLDSEMDFQKLLEAIGKKFGQAQDFFRSKEQIAIKIENRKLSNKELEQVIEVIHTTADLNIAYVIEEDQILETKFKQLVEQSLIMSKRKTMSNSDNGQFYKGTLRSGQHLECDGSVIVMGDVNPGAKVSAKGNVVVLGCVKGNVYAGTNDNDKAFIVALDMKPMQIRIGSYIARSSDEGHKNKRKRLRKQKKEEVSTEAQMAFVENGQVYIEPISRALINEISV